MHPSKNILLSILFIFAALFCIAQQKVQIKNIGFDSVQFQIAKSYLNSLSTDDFAKDSFIKENSVLRYRLLNPLKNHSRKPYPLIITLHNSSRIGTDNEKQLEPLARIWLQPQFRSKYPAYVLVPQFSIRSSSYSINNNYNILTGQPSPEVVLLLDLISQLKKRPEIDSNRIYLTGYSMGASTAQNLLARQPNWFAAMVSIAGVPDFSNLPAFENKPVWLIHGSNDADNPFAGSVKLHDLLKKNAALRFTVYKQLDHNNILAPVLLSPGIPNWLFQQKLPNK